MILQNQKAGVMAGQFPNPDTQFRPGQSGNPGGKTREHRQAEIKAAELAAKARLGLVQAFANLVDGVASDEERHALMTSEALRLLKDSEDRAFGTPVQSVETTSPDGSMTPRTINIVPVAAKKT